MCVYRCVAPPLCGKSQTFAASTKESANISNTTEQRLGIRVFGNPPFEKIKRASVKSAHLQQRVLCSGGFKSLQLPVNCVLHLRKNTKDLGSSKPRKSLMQPAFEPTASFLAKKGGGPEGIRTLGLRVANAALYQLSYEPIWDFLQTISAVCECYYSTHFPFVKIFLRRIAFFSVL